MISKQGIEQFLSVKIESVGAEEVAAALQGVREKLLALPFADAQAIADASGLFRRLDDSVSAYNGGGERGLVELQVSRESTGTQRVEWSLTWRAKKAIKFIDEAIKARDEWGKSGAML